MASVNKVILIGNLGKDPEIKYMPSGDAIASFSVATSQSWKDKKTGEKKEETEWSNCTAFGKLAEVVENYVKKGATVYLEGRLKTEKYQAKDGSDRYSTKVIVDKLTMLGKKGGGDGANSDDDGFESMPTSETAKPRSRKPAPQPVEPLDDDIPF